MKQAFVTASALFFLFALEAKGGPIYNGSFESPDVRIGYFNVGSAAKIPGWQVFGGQVAIYDIVDLRNGVNPSEGRQSLDLSGGGQRLGYGVVSDQIPTVSGDKYWISFDLGVSYPATSNTMGVQINNGPVFTFISSYTPTGIPSYSIDWETKSLEWIADQDSLQLKFTALAVTSRSGNRYVGLDNIQLDHEPAPPVEVPEPGTIFLTLGGLFLIYRTRARKSRNGLHGY